MRVANARKRQFPRNGDPFPVEARGTPGTRQPVEGAADGSKPPARWLAADHKRQAPVGALSVRAQNVLKELALELTGEQAPRGTWSPSRELLLALTWERLGATRNCGPRTVREIVAWAQRRGVTIKPPLPAGQSLSQMWTALVSEASRGALSSAEISAALERSVRRKSTRIPVPFQLVLLKILASRD